MCFSLRLLFVIAILLISVKPYDENDIDISNINSIIDYPI